MFGLFNLFKRKNEKPVEATESGVIATGTIEELADAVLNCSEQVGTFEELCIVEKAKINAICVSVATRLRGKDINVSTLKNSYIAGFQQNGVEVSNKKAELFASAYIDSYLFNR